MKKRVLIITYYWPPSAGSGVQRWLKFAKYLPKYGWEPVIFTPENPDFDLKDESLLKEIAPELEVIKQPIWEPYKLLHAFRRKKSGHPARLMDQSKKSWIERAAVWARANLLVPDPRVFWVNPSVKFLSKRLAQDQFQAIITTGPPHSMHLIGKELKEKYQIPWIADFRDPWSQWEFLDTLPMKDSVRQKHEQLEQDVLRAADQVLTISPSFQQDLETISSRKVQLFTNGFDRDDLPKDFLKKPKNQGGFHLVYTGVIDAIRNPIPLLKAFKEEFVSTGEAVKMSFVGRVSDAVRGHVVADSWLKKHVFFPGYVSHEEVFAFYAEADALVLILTQTKNAKGNIPGKLFEYLSTGIPILALGDPEGDTAQILRDSGAGVVHAHEDFTAIQVELRKLASHGELQLKSEKIESYSRQNLTRKLATLLDESTLS